MIKKPILVVDDDRFMRELLDMILTRAGYEVSFAEDGRTAISKVQDERPDLVLIDGLLPQLHGFYACKAIKELDAPPKVILHTAVYTKPTYKWEVKREYGADDMLSKGGKSADLLACIEKHLAECHAAPMVAPTLEHKVELV